MSEFDWTYDIDAEVIYVGSKFRIDLSTVITAYDIPIENWSNGEFIEFELSWIGINVQDDGRLHLMEASEDTRVVNLVINDCKMPRSSQYEPGYTQIVEEERVRDLIRTGYWKSV
jgi:hypothetical protein